MPRDPTSSSRKAVVVVRCLRDLFDGLLPEDVRKVETTDELDDRRKLCSRRRIPIGVTFELVEIEGPTVLLDILGRPTQPRQDGRQLLASIDLGAIRRTELSRKSSGTAVHDGSSLVDVDGVGSGELFGHAHSPPLVGATHLR